MTGRRLSAFVDALVAGRRPGHFRADPEDAAVLRTAIDLRAARPGDGSPDEQFVSDLFESLADQASSRPAPNVRALPIRRGRATLAAVAAGMVLVGGTYVATEALSQGPVTTATVQAPNGNVMRTGTFETADHRVMGQIVVYSGQPSWVFMNVDNANYDGRIMCKLQADNGATVAVGDFQVHGGVGEWSKTIRVDIGRLRGAKLVTPNGSIVASATFA